MRMRIYRFCRCLSTLLFVLTFLLGLTSVSSAQKREVIQGEYIIQRDPSAANAALSSSNLDVIGASISAELVRPTTRGRSYLSSNSTFKIVPYDEALAQSDCAEISKDVAVISCEPNFVVYNEAFPNDTLFNPYQFNLFNPSATGPGNGIYDARAHLGWDQTVGSDSVVVGVVDSGINYEHPDLLPNLWINPNENPTNGVDDDNNGYVDDIIGIDATNKTNDPFDCNGHGSHVAGIIGAKGNNNRGIAGVAWNVKVVMARNAIDCGPSVSVMSVIVGLDYFYKLKRDNGINIVAVNGSYTGSSFSQAERDALARLALVNVIFTAAAGNGGQDGIGDNIDIEPVYPAGHDLSNIVSIANLDTSRDVYGTGFFAPSVINESSNFGTTSVDIGAPGTDILSTVESGGGEPFFGGSATEAYNLKTGTSMAAPTVAGAIALYKSKHPQHIAFNRIIDQLLNTAFPLNALSGKCKTGATLDLSALLTAAPPSDNCPNDPNKLDAGFCGCGQAENYADGDGDGTPNCADQCPSDAGKAAPGTCGCGVSDADANGNGRVDCLDAAIAGVVPAKPQVSKRGKFTINMTPSAEPGVIYVVKIESSKKSSGGKKKKRASKVKTKFINSATPVLKTKGPADGETFNVSYFYQIPGATAFTSQESPKVKVKG